MQCLCMCRAFQLVDFTIGLLVWGIKLFKDSGFSALLTQRFLAFEKLALSIISLLFFVFIGLAFTLTYFHIHLHLFMEKLTGEEQAVPSGWELGRLGRLGLKMDGLECQAGKSVLNLVGKGDVCTQSNLLKITTNVPYVQPYLSLFLPLNMKHPWATSGFLPMCILSFNSVFTPYPVTGKMDIEESNLSDFHQWPTALVWNSDSVLWPTGPQRLWILTAFGLHVISFSFLLSKPQSNINLVFLYHDKLIPISTPLHLLFSLPEIPFY